MSCLSWEYIKCKNISLAVLEKFTYYYKLMPREHYELLYGLLLYLVFCPLVATYTKILHRSNMGNISNALILQLYIVSINKLTSLYKFTSFSRKTYFYHDYQFPLT